MIIVDTSRKKILKLNWADEIKSSAKKIIHKGIKDLNNREINRNILIHDSRKRVKNIRAILRLIQDELGSKEYKELNTSFKNLNRKSANIRRAYVMLGIIDKESTGIPTDNPNKLIGNLKSIIENRLISYQPKINTNQILREYLDSFYSFEKKIDGWNLKSKDFSLIKNGLFAIYDQGRCDYKLAIRQKDVSIFHELRKSAKDLFYVLEILQKAWPPVIKGYNNQLKILTDYIGDMHDLFEFKLELSKYLKRSIPKEDKVNLFKELDKRIDALMILVNQLGGKVYTEKTKSFIYRINKITRLSINEI